MSATTEPESPVGRRGVTDPDRLAQLEDERRFLLRSLDDLEREHAAGDVDEADYHELRDGYTARAAAVLRAIEEGRRALPTGAPVSWTRRLAAIGVTVALIGLVWWVLSTSSAQRLPGQGPTGADPRTEEQQLLAEARAAQLAAPDQAAALYELVLDENPENVEALTYGGWTRALSIFVSGSQEDEVDTDAMKVELDGALDMLDKATELEPAYPDPYCFRGIVYANFLRAPDLAVDDLEVCQAGNPPADVAELVSGLLERVKSSAAPTTAP